MAGPTSPIVRALLRAPTLLFCLRLGGLFGGRLLLVETLGRSTGARRRTVVEVVRFKRATRTFWVVAGWGRRSDWYRNALANPPVLVDSGTLRLRAPDVVELDEDERFALLRDYQRRHPRVARALGTRLLGAGFTDDETDLRRLAAAVGALRFSPRANRSADVGGGS